MTIRRRIKQKQIKPQSKNSCSSFGKAEPGVASKLCKICPDKNECKTASIKSKKEQAAKSRTEQAEALQERAEIQLEKDRLVKLDEIFASFDEFRETALNFIRQEIPVEEINPEYPQFKRAEELRKLLEKKYHYVKEIEKSYGIQGDFKWPMWTNHEPINTKVSKIFKPVYTLLWRQAKIITHKRTRELTDKYNLPLCGYNHHVIVIPDLKRMSEELKTTLDNIRKQLRRWISNDGPVKKLGLTTQKRDGGKTIYSLGQWINTRNDMMKRNPFFIKDQYNEWLRNIYVHSRKY